MAQRVTAMDVRMRAALGDPLLNVAAFCREQRISRQTYYKWRRRFAEEGAAGLAERSRRPLAAPQAVSLDVEDLIVSWRKELAGQGLDSGADAIGWAMADAGLSPPSRATIWRVLVRRGQVVPAPQKRPHASLHRFVFARPNDCWQCDWTQVHLADGTEVAVAGALDDHSRYCAGLLAAAGDATSELVWAVMLTGFAELGLPAQVLSDNGTVYSMARRGSQRCSFEANLAALGIATITSRPYHPQTCGKIERFWQTLKKWLRHQPTPSSVAELQQQLDTFRGHYNHHRRHRGIDRQVPAAVFAATVKARPAQRPIPAPLTISRNLLVDSVGILGTKTLRINVGVRHAGRRLDLLRDGQHAAVFDGPRLIRQLTIDPHHAYQPSRAHRTTTRSVQS